MIMKSPSVLPLCLLFLAVTGVKTLALPLQRADIAAQPTWVAHVDFDGLRPTAVGQFIQSEMQKPEAQAKLAAFQALFSFDLRTQLHGVSLYSTGTSPQEGVMVLYADFDPARLVTLAAAAKDSQSTSYRQRTIYNWIDENRKNTRKARPHRVYAAIAGARVVFGQREQTVREALDVLDGAAPSLASTHAFPQLGAVGDTSFVEAAARKMNLPDSDPNAAILRLSKLVRLQVNGAHQRLAATLTLEANDEEVAGHIGSIAQGLLALMKLQSGKPEAAKLAEALTLRKDGAQVIISLTLPDAEAVELLKADAARKAQRRAQQAEKN